MRIIALYSAKGHEVAIKSGMIIERGHALDLDNEWIEINSPAKVRVETDWNNQSQSWDCETYLDFLEEDEEEVEEAEDVEDEANWEAQRLEREEVFIANLRALKMTQDEIAHGLKKSKSEYRLNDDGERIAYMVDSILALRNGFEFIKLGDAKNLQMLRGIRTEEAPRSDKEIEEGVSALTELNRKLQAEEKSSKEAVKKAAEEFASSSTFCDIVKNNVVWVEEKSYQTAATASRSDADGDNQIIDLGYNRRVHEPAHYNARKTIWKMIENEIMPCSFFDHVFDRIEEICEQLTKGK